MRRVLASLEKRDGLDLALSLVERQEELPEAWQRITALLAIREEACGQVTEVLAEPGTDLARLQESFLNNTSCDLTGDGTVLLFRAHSEHVLAKGLVQFVYAETGKGGENLADRTTLVAETSGERFDMALAGQDYPLIGNTARSHWRPHLQLLPLALNLLWEPLDPTSLLEFLSHPVNPW